LSVTVHFLETYGISGTPNIPCFVKIQEFPDFPDVFTDPLHDISEAKRILRIPKVSDELLFLTIARMTPTNSMPVVMFGVLGKLDFEMKIHENQNETPDDGGSGETRH
jgi:hypothetical protein